jgi:16S rRNA (cytosine1402-N4)-methyltransferase
MSVEVEAVGTSEAAPAALHVPVLLEETMAVLRPERGGRFVDATVGAGGHAEALLERGPTVRLLGLDRDPGALAAASLRLVRFGARVELRHAPFSGLAAAVGGEPVDGLLADLGVSSMQLDDPARGFSWRGDGGPLDMRMDPTAGAPLGEVLAGLDDEALAEALRTLGEERHARRVARAVRRALDSERGIADTAGLARVVRAAAGAAIAGGGPAASTLPRARSRRCACW